MSWSDNFDFRYCYCDSKKDKPHAHPINWDDSFNFPVSKKRTGRAEKRTGGHKKERWYQ